ncbi:MAG: DUF4214 domain-containing protein, partial [Clostridiaceae bacterium]|nr:DUF4214 domain-containing protein [Clostridiaceae bacterium]
KPHILNMSIWNDLNSDVFLETAYMHLLKRVPDKETLNYWKKRKQSMTKESYQSAVIESIINSEEFAIKKVIVSNNIYCNVKEKQRTIIVNTDSEINGYVERLVKVYRRMPSFLRILAKKILK